MLDEDYNFELLFWTHFMLNRSAYAPVITGVLLSTIFLKM